MEIPFDICMPLTLKEQIKAILPFATDFQISDGGGWILHFTIPENNIELNWDKNFLLQNRLNLTTLIEPDYIFEFATENTPLYIRPRNREINFVLTYKPK